MTRSRISVEDNSSSIWAPKTHRDVSALPPDAILSETLGRKIICVQPGIVIKACGAEYADEVRALKFARSYGLPVPRVLRHPPFRPGRTADFNTCLGKFSVWYFCMDQLPGVSLHSVINSMSQDDLVAVAQQLRDFLSRMASIQSPTKTLGSVDGGPFSNCFFPYYIATRHPFDSVGDFNRYWRDLLVETGCSDGDTETLMSRFPLNAQVCLVHTDLVPRNIMVDGTKITGVVDWAQAGFYPEYWEYACMHNPTESMPGWDALLKLVFPGPRRQMEIDAVLSLRSTLEGAMVYW